MEKNWSKTKKLEHTQLLNRIRRLQKEKKMHLERIKDLNTLIRSYNEFKRVKYMEE